MTTRGGSRRWTALPAPPKPVPTAAPVVHGNGGDVGGEIGGDVGGGAHDVTVSPQGGGDESDRAVFIAITLFTCCAVYLIT